MSATVTRRQFLGTGGRAAAGIAAGTVVHTMLRQARAAEAGETINAALIGCGGMGNYNCRDFMRTRMVNMVAVCDVDQSHLNRTAEMVEKEQGRKPQTFTDYHRVIDLKDVDVVIVSTPDHWHAIPMIAAVAAGKDVYCEKPCCHNIREGRAMVDAARKYNRIVQVGTQQRSGDHFQEVLEFIRSGRLGEISMTETYNYGNEAPEGMGQAPDEPVPPGVDYNAWLGPAPERPFNRRRFHGSFRWYFDYAAGMVGDWNVHLQDIIMWILELTHCDSVYTAGGKFVLRDDRDTPDTMLATYEFGPGKYTPKGHVHLYTMRKASGPGWPQGGYGMVFHGSNGKLFLRRGDYEVAADLVDGLDPNKGRRIEGFRKEGFKEADAHYAHVQNFIECVKTRKKPIASIEDHFNTVTCCHLANVSLRCRSKLYWDPRRELCFTDPQMTSPHEEANRLLGREYRKGFELPCV